MTPTSPFSNAMRSFFGVPPPPPPMQTFTPPSSNPSNVGSNNTNGTPQNTTGSATACLPQFYCSGNSYYYQTSACANQVIQKCPNGCAGNICASSATSSSNLLFSDASGAPVSSLINTDTNTNHATSAIDLIAAIANPFSFSTVNIGTATAIALNSDLGDVTNGVQNSGPQNGTQINASGTLAYVQRAPSNTFVSNDLSNYPGSRYTPQQLSTFQAILSNLKGALVWALSVLQPFGGRAPANSTTQYME